MNDARRSLLKLDPATASWCVACVMMKVAKGDDKCRRDLPLMQRTTLWRCGYDV